MKFAPAPFVFAVALVLLGTPAVCSTSVTVGPGGFLHRDGDPVFPIGAYSPPKGKGAKELAQMGFNLFRTGAGEKQIKDCVENDLWIWHSMNLDFSAEDLDKKKEAVRESAGALKDHPNLLIWESVDEPAWTDSAPEKPRVLPEPLTEGYRFLKTLDDAHPVYLNQAPRNTVETLRKYNYALDIQCVDVYPILPPTLERMYAILPAEGPGGIARQTDLPDRSPAVVGDYVDKMRRVAFHDQAVFVVLQGFAWEALRPEDERDPEKILYATYDELRFMVYQAIVHGANGITIWGLSYNENAEYLSNLSSVLKEVGRNTPAILGRRTGDRPVIRYAERGSGVVKGVETLVTETADTVTLFAVNATINPSTARFVALPQAFDGATELEVLGEDRKISLDAGRFEDDFAGLGVHVYQFKK